MNTPSPILFLDKARRFWFYEYAVTQEIESSEGTAQERFTPGLFYILLAVPPHGVYIPHVDWLAQDKNQRRQTKVRVCGACKEIVTAKCTWVGEGGAYLMRDYCGCTRQPLADIQKQIDETTVQLQTITPSIGSELTDQQHLETSAVVQRKEEGVGICTLCGMTAWLGEDGFCRWCGSVPENATTEPQEA